MRTLPGDHKNDRTVLCGTSSCEMKHGNYFGKHTHYAEDGKITNVLFGKRKPKIQKNITNHPDHAFYSRDGRPFKALSPNWREFIEKSPEDEDLQ